MITNRLSSTLLCFLAICLNVCAAQWQLGRHTACDVQSLRVLRAPDRRIEAEGGVTEIWLHTNAQLHCAGVSVMRQTINRSGLLLPGYNNAAKLTYVVQGRGLYGAVVPGCPETYQYVQQSEEYLQGRQQYEDEHQKVRRVSQGDVVATLTGLVHWFYNDGDTPLTLINLLDTGNNLNQLDHQVRRFFLGGNPQIHQEGEQGAGEIQSNNILRGFDDHILQEVLGVSGDTVERIKNPNDYRGHMVLVRGGLKLVRPPTTYQEEERRRQQQPVTTNGLEETLCTARLRVNFGKASRADVYNPQAGSVSSVSGVDLPILNFIQLSAKRGILRRNAILAPHTNMNAHSVIYAIRGSAHIQIVGNYHGSTPFDGILKEGEVLVVPQNFAVTKRAGSRGFEWISFKTSGNAMTQFLAGKTSALRGLPVDLLGSMYQISRKEAENIKYKRGDELMIFGGTTATECPA